LKTKTPEGLLLDILDPSREVDSRYLNYLVADRSGRVYSGIIAAETATAITLRRAEGMQDTLLRSEIEQIQSTGKSLMPDGFEKTTHASGSRRSYRLAPADGQVGRN
jgi:putative heme-binding domain-containing protein